MDEDQVRIHKEVELIFGLKFFSLHLAQRFFYQMNLEYCVVTHK